MQILAPEIHTGTTKAHGLARQYWEANHRALSRTQPLAAAVLSDVYLDHEWVFARDGSISALENGRWWADCSVPLLAGRTLLKPLSDEPLGSCMLAPFHAGLARAARERMGKCAVLFIAQPDLRVARMILSSHDFSEEIDRHRFWIATGPEWLAQFEQMFTDYPGLATPLRFIRTRLTPDDVTQPMIKEIQDVFSKVLSVRGEEIARLKAEPQPKVSEKTILLVGGGEFRLWDFGARVIEQQLQGRVKTDGLTIRRFDMDDALCGSPLALLRASRECGSVVAVNVSRADCNQLISPGIPWITWMTHVGAPPFQTAGLWDALILADEKWRSVALKAGWPAERVNICGWPTTPVLRYAEEPDRAGKESGSSAYLRTGAGIGKPAQAVIGFICDTRKITVPTSVADFSSHGLLWELIEEELASNPLAVEDVDAYLTDRAGQLNIAADVLNRAKFVDDLILPAYQQGLARLLISAGISIRLWGKGWGDLPEFAPQFAGSISNQDEFEQAIGDCLGLVYCWPTRAAHAMQMIGKPIVHRTGMDRSALIRLARTALGGFDSKAVAPRGGDQLGAMILQLIH